jgi:Tn7-like transposition protein D/Putative transposase of IS4/5 family (DUF4096)
MDRKAYPSDVSDEEWALVASYLTLMTEDAPQRDFPLREVFNGLRWIVRTGAQWRLMPHDLPPWNVVYQQSQRWIKASVFESLVLKYGEPAPGLEALFACYKSIMADKGLIMTRGKIRGVRLLDLFKTSYSRYLLHLLKSDIGTPRRGEWPTLLVQLFNRDIPAHPLRHLLFIRFLGYDVEAFFSRLQEVRSSPPQSVPPQFGLGPWPCLNPVADHFPQPVIEACQVINHAERNIPVGIFKCECGFIYARNGPDAAPEDRFKISRVKAYGPVWEEP